MAGPADDQAADAGIRLFCFPHAGGGPSFFRAWRQALAPDIDVRPVLLPGRESRLRELPYRRVEQLIDPLCSALLPYLDRPYALFGHSMGSIVAYEAARRLARRTGRVPFRLLVSGRRAPELPSRRRSFSALPEKDFLTALATLNGTPPEVLGQPQLVQLLLPALRADFELNETYQPLPGPMLDCPLTACMGLDDPEVDPVELLAWRAVTTADFTLRIFGGDHFYLRDGRPDVLSALRLDCVGAGAPGSFRSGTGRPPGIAAR